MRKFFRVEIEDKENWRHIGFVGSCIEADEDAKTLKLMSDHEAITVPDDICKLRSLRETESIRPYATFTRVAFDRKVEMLHLYGYWDHEASFAIESVRCKTSPGSLLCQIFQTLFRY